MLRHTAGKLRTYGTDGIPAIKLLSTMNRHSNRQARPPRNNERKPPKGRAQTSNINVPSTSQVKPGSSVSIVLKEDQRTGREVQGTVQDLLTRGDHPRGIKVRLKDGRIGRVQRMISGEMSVNSSAMPVSGPMRPSKPPNGQQTQLEDENERSQMPPLRSLGDFMPRNESDQVYDPAALPVENATFTSGAVKCPICGLFEGDEAAVQHHVQEHLD